MKENIPPKKEGYLDRLKRKWGLKSLFQVVVVLVVFSLTGFTVVILRKIFFQWLGYNDQTAVWLKTVTYILLIPPSYQVLILFYGTLLGQFSFFWEKEKKLFRMIAKPFQRSKGDNGD